ncbi:MAG: amidase [Rhizobium sp.]|nr:amidase [Rhizobium sp.]
MTAIPLHYQSITELAEGLKSGAATSVAVTEALLSRIEAVDPGLKSYTTVTAEMALSQAEQADAEIGAGRYRGPLHGVPIAVKDLCYTRGVLTTAGMAIQKDFVPDYDSTVVTRFAMAGAVLLGKLHMTEGATLEHHPEMPQPVNPWRDDLWTGVSSSGSGVATAAGLCFASLGSDTGGSIRFPSASNGVTGVKPTWGRVSRYGICDLAATFDTIGPMARSAADCAAVMGVIAGYDGNDATSLSAPVPDYLGALCGVMGARDAVIGVDWGYIEGGTDDETLEATKAAVAMLRDLGARIVEVTFPDTAELFKRLLSMQLAEIALTHKETFPSQADRYGPWLRDGLEKGNAGDPLGLARAAFARDAFKGALARVMAPLDALVMPINKKGTPTWGEVRDQVANDMNGFMRFTSAFNASGSPTVTSPCGFSSDGRPIGFQLVGRHCTEHRLLAIAHAFQLATDWHLKRPIA